MSHTLYLCYFGLREPLVQTQVLPYLREIKKMDGLKVSLLTFEPNFNNTWTTEQVAAERKNLAEENITWHCLPYHKKPSIPATLYDIFCGARFAARLSRREDIDIFHARSHVSALMGAIAKKISRRKPKLIFDIRGFLPEEYVDAEIWKENSLQYLSLKWIEKSLLRISDGFVILTQNAQKVLFPNCVDTDESGRPFEVIPCCVDFSRFKQIESISREEAKRNLGLAKRKIFVYVGSLGGFYLTEEMADFLAVAYKEHPNVFLMILTQSPIEMITLLLRSRGIPEKDFLVKKVNSDDLPLYLRASDVAISFIKPTFSKRSSSPTKIAEYLAAGVPIIFNSGVGDLDNMLGGENVGAIVENFTTADYKKALKTIFILMQDDDLRARCEQIALKYFALEQVGGVRYRKIYKRLMIESSSHKL